MMIIWRFPELNTRHGSVNSAIDSRLFAAEKLHPVQECNYKQLTFYFYFIWKFKKKILLLALLADCADRRFTNSVYLYLEMFTNSKINTSVKSIRHCRMLGRWFRVLSIGIAPGVGELFVYKTLLYMYFVF